MNALEMHILEHIIKNHEEYFEKKERKLNYTIKEGECHKIINCDYIDLTTIIRDICEIVKDFYSETFVKLMLANVIEQLGIQEQMFVQIKNDLKENKE